MTVSYNDKRWKMYNIQYTIYNIQYTIYNIQYTIYNIQYAIYNIHITVNCYPSFVHGSLCVKLELAHNLKYGTLSVTPL